MEMLNTKHYGNSAQGRPYLYCHTDHSDGH